MSLLSVMGYSGCETCPLDKEARNLKHPKMKPTGAASPDIYILGEAPGATEDEEGAQFVGQSGELLRGILNRVLPPNALVRWSNTVRCRPPGNRTPVQAEITACSVYAEEDLISHTPRVLVLVGASALRWAISESRITAWRGLKIPMYKGEHRFWAVPVLHPAYVLRNGGEDDRNPSFTLLEHDLRTAARTIRDAPPGERVNPAALRACVEVVMEAAPHLPIFLSAPAIGLDIETDSLTPWRCKHGLLSVSVSNGVRTVAFPINHPQARHPENLEALKQFLLQYCGKIVCHNTAFELSWLFKELGPEVALHSAEWHDSMCGQRMALDRESPLGLDEGCLLFLGARIKGETAVDATRWYQYSVEQLLTYNGIDSAACLALALSLGLFDLVGNRRLEYERLRQAAIATALMSHEGLPLNIHVAGDLEKEEYAKIREITDSLHEMPDVVEWSRKNGKPFNPSSDQQVADFFESKGLIQPGKGTSEPVLRDVNHSLAPRILEIRRHEKLVSTYLSSWPKVAGSDGLLHPRYTVCHVATGRLSSEDPNIQNVPKRKDKWIRKCIEAPPGMDILALDYSQLEIRVLAMMCKDPILIQELWAKTDLHTGWMNRTIELYPPILDRIAEEYALDDEKKIRKTLRDEIKRGVTFALPYGSSKHTPGRILQIPDEISIQLAEEHRRHYPGIYAWQEEMRRAYADHGYVEIPFTRRRRTGILEGNEPLNTPIQGTASDIVVSAMIRLSKRGSHDRCLLPRINIHDDLTFFIPKGAHEQYGNVIAQEMIRIVHPMVNVPLEVEASYGPNWYDQTTFATYSSADFGHRRERRQSSALPEVSPEEVLGGTWAEFGRFRVAAAAVQPLVPPRVPIRRPLRVR